MAHTATSTLLAWHALVGADALVGEVPCSLLTPKAAAPATYAEAMAVMAPAPKPAATAPARTTHLGLGAPIPSLTDALTQAKTLADASTNFAQWQENVRAFDGCPLKRTATNTVVGDGNPDSRLLFIGEAPGNDEDKQGIPFCGVSGQLLGKMLAAIGLPDRSHYYISNSIYWRPPGNRNPTPDEVALCRPFMEKLITLIQPRIIVLVGGVAAKNVLNTDVGITKLRGKTHRYQQADGPEIPAFALYHPSFLLRQPLKKKEAWEDLQVLRAFLDK